MALVTAFALTFVLLAGVMAELDLEGAGIATSVGLLPLEVAGQTHSSELSLSLLQRALTDEEAELKSEQLQEALLRDKESTIQNLFVAWSKANNKFYTRLSESEIALRDFRKNVELQLQASNASSEWMTDSATADGSAATDASQFQAGQGNTVDPAAAGEDTATRAIKPRFSHLFRTRRLLGDPVPVFKTAPAAYNHSAQGNLSPVVNQGLNCASCWANSAATTIDAAVAIYYKSIGTTIKPLKFSRQALVDCVNVGFTSRYFYSSDNGCQLGSPGDALYFAGNYSIPLETAYPYVSAITSSAGICNHALLNLKTSAQGGTWATLNGVLHYTETDINGYPIPISESNLMKAVYNQPVVILWCVATNMMQNKGQIYTLALQKDPSSGCFNDADHTDHAMTLVGYDTTKTPNIWIIQNSWGPAWGANGFFLVQMTHDTNGPCGMHFYVVAPAISFVHPPIIPAANIISVAAKPPPPRTGH